MNVILHRFFCGSIAFFWGAFQGKKALKWQKKRLTQCFYAYLWSPVV
jgi:hypothetical protein